MPVASARISTSPIHTVCASGLLGIRITLQRTLVQHVGLAVRLRVVDQQPRLEVLAVVGEVGAEQLGVAAGTGEPHRRRGAHDVAAEGDVDVPEHRVLAEPGVMGADVHHVVGPVGDPDDAEACRVADDDLDVVGVGSAAAQVDHDDGPGQFLDPDLQMPVGHRTLAGAGRR